MSLSVGVTLVFVCVVFYAGLLLYLALRQANGEEGPTSQRGPADGT